MAITSKFLRDIMTEARPIIERQMNDAKLISGFQKVVSAAGGDWGALKALIKAHVEDENDEAGEGKRVQKILEKADSSTAYADMLGLVSANMNENNFSAGQSYAEVKGIEPKLIKQVVDGMQTAAGRAALVTAIDVMIEREDAETGEILTQEQPSSQEAEIVTPQFHAQPAPAESMGDEISAPIQEQPEEPASQSDQPPVSAGGCEYAGTSPDENPAPIHEQPETADEVPAASGTDRWLSVAGPKDAIGRQPVDTLRAERGRPGEGVTAGETAPIPHSPAQAPHALQADKTSEAVCSSPASLAPPAGTKHTETNFGSDPLNNAPSAEADQAGAIVGHPVSAVAPAAIPDSDVPAFLRKDIPVDVTSPEFIKRLRPFCQHLDDCHGHGRECSKCKAVRAA